MKRTIPLLVAAVLVVGGCSAQTTHDPARVPAASSPGSAGTPTVSTAMNLDDTSWHFVEVAGKAVPPKVNATLHLRHGRASGKAGCNTYGASYHIAADGAASFQRAMSTKMACLEPAGAMQVERGVFAALQHAARVERSGDTLTLLDASGAPLAKLAADAKP